MDELTMDIMDLSKKTIINSLIFIIMVMISKDFDIINIWAILIMAVFITIIDFLLQGFDIIKNISFLRGLTGFLISIAILYLTENLIAGINFILVYKIIVSIIIGLIDIIIPTEK